MGLSYNKRIGNKSGFGVNISTSGISSSYRSKYGTIGSKGFSVRTGIPGLTFRSGWKSSKNKGSAALILIIIGGIFIFAYFFILVFYNVIRFIIWLITQIYNLAISQYYKYKERHSPKLEELPNDIKESIN